MFVYAVPSSFPFESKICTFTLANGPFVWLATMPVNPGSRLKTLLLLTVSDPVHPRDIWTSQEPLYTERDEYWAKLRVLYDRKLGIKYYDILYGKKGEKDPKKKTHFRFNLDGNILYPGHRNLVTKIRHEAESQLHGKILDESRALKPEQGKMNLVFRVAAIGPSGESRVEAFELVSIK